MTGLWFMVTYVEHNRRYSEGLFWPYNESQLGSNAMFIFIVTIFQFFKISSLEFHWRNKVILVWNDTRESKLWQNCFFQVQLSIWESCSSVHLSLIYLKEFWFVSALVNDEGQRWICFALLWMFCLFSPRHHTIQTSLENTLIFLPTLIGYKI